MPRNVASGGAHGRRRGRVVVHTVAAFFIGLCAWGTARVADANATGPACDDAVAKRSEERVTDVRVSLSNVLPMSRDILRGVDGFTFFNKANGQLAVDLIFKDIRNLDVPKALSDTIAYENKSPSEFLKDPRSTIRDLWRVDEATVAAADLAYDVEDTVHPDLTSTGRLDPARVEQRLPNYTVVKSFADTYTGFKAVVLESREGLRRGSDAHRIYAIAGTQVFVNTDFRDWASGLTLARTQFVSDAALLLIKDAADYARDPDNGGEVFVTGQSQGAVISQGLGYLLQAYLSSTTAPHRLVHVVSWGGTGALEAIVRMIDIQRQGKERGFPPAFEQHWSQTAPDHQRAMQVWSTLASVWDRVPGDGVEAHVRSVARGMRVIGFFFAIDPFARAGTFLGTSMVFPTELVLPKHCEALVTEHLFETRIGTLGITLESHFLNGYERAVERGAIAFSRPAKPEKWERILTLMPTAEAVGEAWLADFYLRTLGSSDVNWRRCLNSEEWMTDQNRSCRKGFWPGCSPQAEPPSNEPGLAERPSRWCLIKKGTTASASLPSASAAVATESR